MSERALIVRHALTVLVGQWAVMAFGLADTVVAGRHSAAALAALSVGAAIFISIFIALTGVLQALLPLWAEWHGAQAPARIGRSVRQALYLWALLSVLGMALLLAPDALLRWAEVPPPLRAEVQRYLAVLAFALPANLLFRVYGTLNQALGMPHLVTWLQLGSLLFKLPLSVWFTFGGAGLPALGAAGCAWATVLVQYGMLALALWLLRRQSVYAPLQLWRRLEPLHLPSLAQFARLGVPAGLAILVEVTSFTLMSLFVARQGTVAAAAHQIAANVAGMLYALPLALAIATSARASFWLGRGQHPHAKTMVWMGFRLAVLVGAASIVTILIAKNALAALYSRNPEVLAIAAGLLPWAAAYHAADVVQTFCVFMLRSYRITVAPLVIYSLLLWGLGLGGGYVLAYQGLGPWAPQPSPRTFWATSALALTLVAALFLALLQRALKARVQAARPPANESPER